MVISRLGRRGSSAALALAACFAGCARATAPATGGGFAPGGGPRLPPPLPMESVFVLESVSAPPEDTVVRIPPDRARTILLRRGPPDFSLFALLEFPAGTLVPAAGAAAVTLTIKPRPGQFGLDLEADGTLKPGASVTFSYAVDFVAPAGARERYGGALDFERALLVARVGGDGRLIFLPTTRPGSDMVSVPLEGPGRYLVAAPR